MKLKISAKNNTGVSIWNGVGVALIAMLCLANCAIENDDLGLKGQPRMESATDMRSKPDTSFIGQRIYKQHNLQQSVFFAHNKSTLPVETADVMLNNIVTFLNDNSNASVQ